MAPVADGTKRQTVSSEEAGRIIGVSGQAVRKWIEKGKLPATKDDHQWHIALVDVLRERYWREFRDRLSGKVEGEYRRHYANAAADVARAARDYLEAFRAFRDSDSPGGSPVQGPWADVDQAAVDLRDAMEFLMSQRGAYPYVHSLEQGVFETQPDHTAGDREQVELPLEV